MQGLITKGRKDLDPAVARFARGFGPEEVEDLYEGASLVEVVFKFDVLYLFLILINAISRKDYQLLL